LPINEYKAPNNKPQ